METLFDVVPGLNAYRISFLVIIVLAIISLVQNVLTAPLAFLREEQVPGMPLRFDHSKLSFRVLRTYSNSAESVPTFGFTLLVAIVVGVSSSWVNGLAVLYLLSRLAFWLFYYSGVGKIAGGPRTLAYVLGLFVNFILALLVLWVLV